MVFIFINRNIHRSIILLIVGLLSFPAIGQNLDSVVSTKQRKQRNLFAFPAIIHSPELLFAFGGAGNYYFRMGHDTTVRTSFIQGLGLISLRKQIVFGIESTIFFPNEKYLLKTRGSISRFPDRFWGLGNNSSASSVEKYSISQYYIFPQLLRKTYKNLFLGVAYEFQDVFSFEYGDGKPADQSIFDTQNVPGRHGSVISGMGFTVIWDGRDNTFSPSKGTYFSYYINQFTPLLGSQYTYLAQTLDLRHYFKITKTHVLAFQAVGNFSHGNVPVRSLYNIGSSSMLRGYYEGRFTDKNMVGVQGEYRFPVIWRFGLVGFAGVGRVSNRVSQLDLTGLKDSYGFGVRYAVDKVEKLNLRLDFGWGEKSSGIYFNLTEAF